MWVRRLSIAGLQGQMSLLLIPCARGNNHGPITVCPAKWTEGSGFTAARIWAMANSCDVFRHGAQRAGVVVVSMKELEAVSLLSTKSEHPNRIESLYLEEMLCGCARSDQFGLSVTREAAKSSVLSARAV